MRTAAICGLLLTVGGAVGCVTRSFPEGLPCETNAKQVCPPGQACYLVGDEQLCFSAPPPDAAPADAGPVDAGPDAATATSSSAPSIR